MMMLSDEDEDEDDSGATFIHLQLTAFCSIIYISTIAYRAIQTARCPFMFFNFTVE